MIHRMMMREGGANEWSVTHNSMFEATKSVLINFSQSKKCCEAPIDVPGGQNKAPESAQVS